MRRPLRSTVWALFQTRQTYSQDKFAIVQCKDDNASKISEHFFAKRTLNENAPKKSDSFQLGSSIPVLRILDEALARSFYVEFLGFGVDWEHRFNEDEQSPIYMQVSFNASVLHLNGHANDDTPVSEIRIPVIGLQEYCDFLCDKKSEFAAPEVVDPRYEGRNTDMNILDPFGNHLVFWAPSESSDG